MLVERDYLHYVSKHDDLFRDLMNGLIGGVSLDESWALRRYAASITDGCIVEIGSYRGKSAVALSVGVVENSVTPPPMIYCIDPHQPYVGFYGGVFGPIDRGHFYNVMVTTGAYNFVSPVNLRSLVAARSWEERVGLLFIDGSHHYDDVKEDFNAWSPHVCANGYIAFDDAQDVTCGPWRVVNEALVSGQYCEVERVGKVVVLQKRPPKALLQENGQKNILVVCERIVNSGGLWRFDRIASSLERQGHKLYFLPLDQNGPRRPTNVPVLQIDEALRMQWDATMVAGAGFSQETVGKLSLFKSPRYGVRVQHILNDQTRKDAFLAVNRTFEPHIVIFNNHGWPPGSFTDFQAQRFHTLIGAVDCNLFTPTERKSYPLQENAFIVGGLANKNHQPLLEALRLLPADVSVKLFGDPPADLASTYADLLESGRLEFVGPLQLLQLVEFYHGVDLTVHTQLFAGWANLVAESMASGVPVICTKHGTSVLAQDKVSALVLETVTPEEIAQSINTLRHDHGLRHTLVRNGLAVVQKYNWNHYSEQLLELCKKPSNAHDFDANDLGLYGKWPISWRLEGLDKLIKISRNKSILEIGSSEVEISREFMKAGATLLHGFKIDPERTEFTEKLCDSPASVFRTTRCASWDEFYADNNDLLRPCYDIVLFLDVFLNQPNQDKNNHEETNNSPRSRFLDNVLKLCNKYIVIRSSSLVMSEASSIIAENGFVLDHTLVQTDKRRLGSLCVYKRASNPIHFISYPKSGRSWIRYTLTMLGVADQFCFHHDQFEFNDATLPNHNFSVSDRLARYPRHTKIVFMRRNPFDVIVSLYHQITGRFKDIFHYDETLTAFIRDPYFGAIVLRDYLRMWDTIMRERNVLVVSYEDMHEQPTSVISALLEFADIHKSNHEILQAIHASSFTNMKRVESEGEFNRPWLRTRNGAPKVRKGIVGGYMEELSSADIEYLHAVFKE